MTSGDDGAELTALLQGRIIHGGGYYLTKKKLPQSICKNCIRTQMTSKRIELESQVLKLLDFGSKFKQQRLSISIYLEAACIA